MVFLLAGTNDMYRNPNELSTAPNRLASLVDEILTSTTTNTTVFVGSIPPLSFAQQQVNTYNANSLTLINQRISAGKRVVHVPMTAIGTGDLADGVHPNQAGYQKMAAAWLAGVTKAQGNGWL